MGCSLINVVTTPAATPTSPRLRYYYPVARAGRPAIIEADVCIYGGTSAGVAAAVQASRMGRRAVIAEFGKHLGGLSSGGLSATDIGNKAAIGGFAREFYRRLGRHYGNDETWTFEPHVAERVFNNLVREARVPVHFEQRLAAVKKQGSHITEIVMENGNVFRAKVFIDATYEGDLMALAGVSYHVGREANAVYRETLNGVQFGHPNHNFEVPLDPYIIPGDPGSGLLPGISDEYPGQQGAGDHRVQAYNFRLCLTNVPENRLPFPKPRDYDPNRYTLLARYIQAGVWNALHLTKLVPNSKTDTNNLGGFSTDNIGMNHEWPEGDYATRERIFQDHVTYQQGLVWFLCHDEHVPAEIREAVCEWGLPKNEFQETGGWPHQLYVREARRMISDYVMTEHHCRGRTVVANPVGLAAYQMDSHHCQRVVVRDLETGKARVVNEGNVEMPSWAPYPISYDSIVPKREDCSNLLVPVCLSASHIAYGSIRMEPVFMVLGQSAATAAVLAIEARRPVQRVDYEALRLQLLKDRQILDWTPGYTLLN
ncbi:MAG: FAD-dependent oxidoreductase [Armatimonadota bacterium]|nr:FAD-dependent oxidoreductase [Armatimonadota bacterium]